MTAPQPVPAKADREAAAFALLCERLQRDPASSADSDTCSLRAARNAMVAFSSQNIAAQADLLGALRWLRAFWRPGSDHDTQEVQHALAAADAAIAAAQGEG
jgi:hypothetical protein